MRQDASSSSTPACRWGGEESQGKGCVGNGGGGVWGKWYTNGSGKRKGKQKQNTVMKNKCGAVGASACVLNRNNVGKGSLSVVWACATVW